MRARHKNLSTQLAYKTRLGREPYPYHTGVIPYAHAV